MTGSELLHLDPRDCALPPSSDCPLNVQRIRVRSFWGRLRRRFVFLNLMSVRWLMTKGQLSAALTLLRLSVILLPHELLLRIWLAQVALNSGKQRLAHAAILPRFIDRAPGIPNHASHVARVHLLLRNPTTAVRYASLARSRRPHSVPMSLLHSQALRESGDEESSRKVLEEGLDVAINDSQRCEILLCLADGAYRHQDLDRAASLNRRILALRPTDAIAHLEIVNCSPDLQASSEIAMKMKELLHDRTTNLATNSYLHYALGHLCDRTGQYGAAMSHYLLANRLRPAPSAPGTGLGIADEVSRRRAVFTREWIHRHSVNDNLDDVICIVGMPCSGVSLLHAHLLRSAPVHESYLSFRSLISDFSLQVAFESDLPFPLCCCSPSKQQMSAYGRGVTARITSNRSDNRPTLLRGTLDFLDLGFIYALLPRVRFVHISRHPVDTCLSLFTNNSRSEPWLNNSLNEVRQFYEEYRRMMDHWRVVLPNSSLFEVTYENLVRDPETVVRSICKFLELPSEADKSHSGRNGDASAIGGDSFGIPPRLHSRSVLRSNHYREFLGALASLEAP